MGVSRRHRGPHPVVATADSAILDRCCDWVNLARFRVGFANTQGLGLGDLQRFIERAAFADQLPELNELWWLVEGDRTDEPASAAV
jgi:hypothetical protein